MLEKTLVGYKELCEALEKDNNASNQHLVNPNENAESAKTFEYLKKEIETLRNENERLRRRKEEMELEMEHRCLKGDFNVDKYKVVVVKDSPCMQAYKESENLVERLQAEVFFNNNF